MVLRLHRIAESAVTLPPCATPDLQNQKPACVSLLNYTPSHMVSSNRCWKVSGPRRTENYSDIKIASLFLVPCERQTLIWLKGNEYKLFQLCPLPSHGCWNLDYLMVHPTLLTCSALATWHETHCFCQTCLQEPFILLVPFPCEPLK